MPTVTLLTSNPAPESLIVPVNTGSAFWVEKLFTGVRLETVGLAVSTVALAPTSTEVPVAGVVSVYSAFRVFKLSA